MTYPLGWLPWVDIPDCVVAYSMHTDTYDAGTGTWTERTGHFPGANLVQAVPANKPTEGANYLQFDGINDFMATTAASLETWTIPEDYTFLGAVRQIASVAAFEYIWDRRDGAAGNGLHCTGGTFWRMISDTGANVTTTSNVGPVNGTDVVLTWWRDTTDTTRMRRDGVVQADSDVLAGELIPVAAAQRNLNVGGRDGATGPWNGRVYCLLWFSRQLTTLEMQQVEYWLDQTFDLGRGLADPGGWPFPASQRTYDPYLYFVVEGLGPDTDAAASDTPYRWSSRDPGLTPADRWRPYLVDIPGQLETTLDVVTGETKVGSMTFSLLEGSASAFLTNLFATREAGQVGDLAADVAIGAPTIDVYRSTGVVPAVGQVLSLGDERMRISGVAAGAGVGGSDRLTVTKGYYSTTDRAHYTAANGGDSEVRYRAHFLRTRRVTLYLNYVAPGRLESQSVVVGEFLLDRLALGDDGCTWELSVRGLEALLDAEIGTLAWTGATTILQIDFLNRWANAGVIVFRTAHSTQTLSDDPYSISRDAANGGYIRFGDALSEFETTDNPGAASQRLHITEWELAGTTMPDGSVTEIQIREVLPTDARLDHTFFRPVHPTAGAGASDHPIDIFLALATSTGNGPWPIAGTNFRAGETNWDVLPRGWGRGIPIALIDTEAFLQLRQRMPGVRMPNFVLGWDGAFNFKEFVEKELLGPLGISVVQDEHGILTAFRVSEVFVGDDTTTLGADDIIPQSESFSWDFDDQVLEQVYSFDHFGPEGEALQVLNVVDARARFRYGQRLGDKTLTVESHGLRGDSGRSLLTERSMFIARHFTSPPPRVVLRLNWQHLFIPLGDPVLLTLATLPNVRTGARGLTAESFIVIRRKPMFREIVRGGNGGGVEVELFWVGLDQPRLVTWAPSAIVNDNLSTATVAVRQNEFTDQNPDGRVPTNDTDAFTSGPAGVGDTVILLDSDGVARCSNTPTVLWATPTTLELSDTFRLAGVPVVRVANSDVIVYSGESGAPIYPISAWTTAMRRHGAWSDEATRTIGDTVLLDQWGD